MLGEERGAHEVPLIVIFGVFLAFLLMLIFVNVYSQQAGARVDEEANSLLEQLSQTVFQSFSTQTVSSVQLPLTLGGCQYVLEVVDNSNLIVRILSGLRAGSEYIIISQIPLSPDNSAYQPGTTLYFGSSDSSVLLSQKPIEITESESPQFAGTPPPEFYYFAKKHPVEAASILEAFFVVRENLEVADASRYAYEENSVLVELRLENDDTLLVKAKLVLDTMKVGAVENAVVVSAVESHAGEQGELVGCPSVDNAWMSGWVYSPSEVLAHLSSRTWKNENDVAVSLSSDARVSAAAVTTNVGQYPAWRVESPPYVIYYRAMPWWELENEPGFLFQSYPPLEPVI